MRDWYITSLLVTYGSRIRPTRSALYRRLGTAICLSGAAGLLSLYAVRDSTLPLAMQSQIITLHCIYGSFCGFSLVLIGARIPWRQNQARALLATLPVSKYLFWGVWMAPIAPLVICLLLAVLPASFYIGFQIGLTPLEFAYCGVALMSSVCFVYATATYLLRWRLGLSAVVLGILCLALRLDNPIFAPALLLVGPAALIYAFASGQQPQRPHIPRPISRSTPWPLWYCVKLLRNKTACFSITAATALTCALAYAYVRYHIPLGNTLWMAGMILTTAAVADIRGLMPDRPPEITALRGTVYYCKASLLGAIFAALVIFFPLSLGAILERLPLVSAPLYVLCAASLGGCIGAIVRPRPGDPLCQLLAGLCSLGLFFGIVRLTQGSNWEINALLAAISVLSLTATVVWEYKHNPFLWRKT